MTGDGVMAGIFVFVSAIMLCLCIDANANRIIAAIKEKDKS